MQTTYATQQTRWARIGACTACTFTLAYVETFLPLPIPGLRLGLANVGIILAFYQLGVADAALVACAKTLVSAVLLGSPFAFVYSLAGTILSFVGMAIASRFKTMHPAMVSVVGAVLHAVGQLGVAAFILQTDSVWLGAPALLVGSIVTGVLSGFIASRSLELLEVSETQLAWQIKGSVMYQAPSKVAENLGHDAGHGAATRIPPWIVLLGYLVFVIVVVHVDDAGAQLLFLCVSAALALVSTKSFARLARAALPVLPVALATTVFQLILSNRGGGLRIQEIPILWLRLGAVVWTSTAVGAVLATGNMHNAIQKVLKPLEKLGVDVDGLALAAEVAAETTPRLADSVAVGFTHANVSLADASFWADYLPSFVVATFETALGGAGEDAE